MGTDKLNWTVSSLYLLHTPLGDVATRSSLKTTVPVTVPCSLWLNSESNRDGRLCDFTFVFAQSAWRRCNALLTRPCTQNSARVCDLFLCLNNESNGIGRLASLLRALPDTNKFDLVPTLLCSGLQELNFPWTVRKIMVKYASQSTDIIKQSGNAMRITTVNAKGSWTRDLIDGRDVSQVPGLLLLTGSQPLCHCPQHKPVTCLVGFCFILSGTSST